MERSIGTYTTPPITTPNGFSSAAKPMVASCKKVSLDNDGKEAKVNTDAPGYKQFRADLALVTPFTKKGNRKCLQNEKGETNLVKSAFGSGVIDRIVQRETYHLQKDWREKL